MSQRPRSGGARPYLSMESLEPRTLLSLTWVQLGEQDFTGGNPQLSSLNAAGANEPFPFDRFYGNDGNIGGISSASFRFAFNSVPPGDLVLQFGIADHDTAWAGNQVARFVVMEKDAEPETGVDLTEPMRALMESYGGENGEYNVYTLALPPAATDVLAGGGEFLLSMTGPTSALNGTWTLNGAYLDFARLAPRCAINLEPLELEGDFVHNDTLNRCESNETVLIRNGPAGPDIQVSGGTVWLDEQTLHATGTFSARVGTGWQTLFSGTATINLAGSNDEELVLDQPTLTTLPDSMRPAGLPVEFSAVRILPAQLQFEGDFVLPEFVGGLKLTPQHFLVDEDALTIAGGFISVPDVDVSLFKAIQVKTSGLQAGYNAAENEVELSGSFTLKSLVGKNGPSITATFPAGNGIGIGPDGVDFNGTLSASDLGVVPGLFTLKNITLTINVQNSTLISYGGAAKVELVKGWTVDGSFSVVNGELDAVALSGSGLKLPVGSTGLMLQRVSGSVTGLAEGDPDPTFTGGVGFSYGPEYTINLPDAFGGEFKDVSLLSIDLSASATLDFFDFENSEVVLQASATVKLLGGVATGTGSIRMDFRRVILDVDTTFTALAGFITSQTHLTANASLNLSASGSAAIKIPDSVPLVGGTQLFGGKMFLNYRHNDTLADDYIAGYADIATFFGTFRTGARVNFDGTSQVLGLVPLAQAPTPVAARASGASAVAAAVSASGSFQVDAGSTFVVLSAAWTNALAGGVAVRVRAPDGTIHTPATFGSTVDYLDEFTSAKRATVVLKEPMPGTWTLELPDADALGTVTFEGFDRLDEPTMAFTSTAQAFPGGQVPIAYQATSPNTGTAVTLFYDTDATGFDGHFLAEGLAPGDGTYVWDTAGFAPGVYHVYSIVTDDAGAPVFRYAPWTVRVGDELPRPQGPEFPVDPDGAAGLGEYDAATNASGDLVVVWVAALDGDDSRAKVYGRKFRSDGTPAGDRFLISQLGESDHSAETPSVAIDAAGGFAVAWAVESDLPDRIVARRFDAAGQPLGDQFAVSDGGDASDVHVAVNALGEFAIVWVSEMEDDAGALTAANVMMRRYTAAGVPRGGTTVVSTVIPAAAGGEAYTPAVVATGDAWAVSWGIENPDTGRVEFYLRAFDPDGAPRSDAVRVAPVNTGYRFNDSEVPAVQVTGDGTLLMAWTEWIADFGRILFVQRHGPDGAPLGERTEVPGFPRNGTVRILAAADGGFLATWTDNNGNVHARRHGPDGAALTPHLDLSDHTIPHALPLLTGDAGARFVAVWTADPSGIYARAFDDSAALGAPRVAGGAFEYQNAHEIAFRFTKDVRGSLRLSDLVLTNTRTGAVVASSGFTLQLSPDPLAPTTATWRRTGRLPDGHYRATLSLANIKDAYGNAAAGSEFAFEFRVLSGDANGDGRINSDDYFRIDSSFLAQPASPSYNQGDFNFDDRINSDDYFLIDSAFLAQGAQLVAGRGDSLATTAVAARSSTQPGAPSPLRSAFSDANTSIKKRSRVLRFSTTLVDTPAASRRRRG